MKIFLLSSFFSFFALAGCKRDYNESSTKTKNATTTPELPTTKEQDPVLTCESYGAKLVIDTAPTAPGTSLEARLSGKIAEHVRDEQGKDVTATGGGYDSGKSWTTKKVMPDTFVHNFDKGEAPVVILQGLTKRESNGEFLGYFRGQYDPAVVKEKTGYKVVLPYFKMTGSKTTISYEYAHWFFADKDCK